GDRPHLPLRRGPPGAGVPRVRLGGGDGAVGRGGARRGGWRGVLAARGGGAAPAARRRPVPLHARHPAGGLGRRGPGPRGDAPVRGGGGGELAGGGPADHRRARSGRRRAGRRERDRRRVAAGVESSTHPGGLLPLGPSRGHLRPNERGRRTTGEGGHGDVAWGGGGAGGGGGGVRVAARDGRERAHRAAGDGGGGEARGEVGRALPGFGPGLRDRPSVRELAAGRHRRADAGGAVHPGGPAAPGQRGAGGAAG